MRIIAHIATLLTITAAAPVCARDFCDALKRIEAASREPVMFSSLEETPSLIPGYRHCRVSTGDDGVVLCHTQLASADLDASRLAERVSECLGIAPNPPSAAGASRTFTLAPLRLVISSSCDERCQVGRVSTFIVRRLRDSEN